MKVEAPSSPAAAETISAGAESSWLVAASGGGDSAATFVLQIGTSFLVAKRDWPWLWLRLASLVRASEEFGLGFRVERKSGEE